MSLGPEAAFCEIVVNPHKIVFQGRDGSLIVSCRSYVA